MGAMSGKWTVVVSAPDAKTTMTEGVSADYIAAFCDTREEAEEWCARYNALDPRNRIKGSSASVAGPS